MEIALTAKTVATVESKARIHVRMSQRLLDEIKSRAKARGVPHTRYIRLLMERDVAAK